MKIFHGEENMSEKSLKKRIIAGALAVISAASFCGCMDEDWDDDYDYDDDSGYYEEDEQKVGSSAPSDSSSYTARSSSLVLENDGSISLTRKQRDAEVPMGEDGTWTVFVYLCGSDLESGNGLGVSDMEEMVNASTSENIKFVVQTGGAAEWNGYGISENSHQRYVITDGDITLVDEISETGMGQTSTLADFLSWGVGNYPAAKMGLVFWNHGGGSITGVCFDENKDYDSLSLGEIDSALTYVFDSMTDKFEFIGFDACLMATVENANMLVPHARYMFASEELEPGYGWDYTTIGQYLDSNPNCDGAELGKVVADSFYSSCADVWSEDSATFSVIDLSKIDALVQAVNDAAAGMYTDSEDPAVLAAMVRGIGSAKNYGGNNKSEGYTNMVDLGSLMSAALTDKSAVSAVLSAIDAAVIYNIYGENEVGSTGLSTYYPLMVSGSQELSIFKDICISPYYMAFVDRIAYGSSNGGNVSDYTADDTWLSDGAEYWDNSNDSGSSSFWNFFDTNDDEDMSFVNSSDNAIAFSEEPHINESGYFSFSFDNSCINNVDSVNCSVYYVDDEANCYYELGIDNYVYVDWDSGYVEDLFDGLWYTLADGQLLAMYIVEENEDFDIYSVPVLLNGEATNLRIRHEITEENDGAITILGAWDSIDSNGQASKKITKLKNGDVIVPLYYTYNPDGNYVDITQGEEFVFDGDSSVYLDYLPDNDYQYSFEINDIFGSSYYTDFTVLTVEDGEVFFN